MSRAGSLVAARIVQAPACEVIELTETEKEIYRGAGRSLAVFEKGVLTKLFSFGSWPYIEDPQAATAAGLTLTRQWLEDAEYDGTGDTEIWFVHCSCYQLCGPRQMSSREAAAMAFLANQVAAEVRESLDG